MASWKLIMFTKHLQGLDLDRVIAALKSVGVEGADLCVRPGYPVTPDNVLNRLPEAVRKFQNAGLCIPMITTPGEFVSSKDPSAEKIMAACQQAGVKLIKLGYWYMEPEGYWKTVDKLRLELAAFSSLAEKYQVKVMVHNHSGNTMGLNSCSVMNLVKGLDPKYVGVFTDPGHLSLVGEPLPMALDIVKDYISALAVKDLIKERTLQDGKRGRQLRVVPLGEGYVNWYALAEILLRMKFSGPVSIHSEYAELDVDGVIDQTRLDVRFFKKVVAAVESGLK